MFPHSTLREVTPSDAQNNLHAPTQILEALRGDAVVVRALHQRTLLRGAAKGFGTCMHHRHGRGAGSGPGWGLDSFAAKTVFLELCKDAAVSKLPYLRTRGYCRRPYNLHKFVQAGVDGTKYDLQPVKPFIDM